MEGEQEVEEQVEEEDVEEEAADSQMVVGDLDCRMVVRLSPLYIGSLKIFCLTVVTWKKLLWLSREMGNGGIGYQQ